MDKLPLSIAEQCDYPTPAALAYRDTFVVAAKARGLLNIPEDTLSWAIDRAIVAGTPAATAGSVFADCYYRTVTKPDYRDPERRNGIMNRTAFLLSEFDKELKRCADKT